MPDTSATAPRAISDALARIWAKFLPDIEARVALLDAAATSLAAGTLTTEQRQAAHAAAHKLAGSLGTFGLHRGTDLARQAELLLAEEVSTSATTELAAWVAELRLMIQDRA